MRPRWLSAVACGLALAPAGCFLFPRPAPDRVLALSSAVGPAEDTPQVTFDTRLIEQPADDPYLARAVWRELTDPLPHALTALLAANGLRVGVAHGPPSAQFERLAGRAGVVLDPMVRRGVAGKPKTIPVNGPLDRCAAEVLDDLTADPRTVAFAAAECAVIVTGTPQPSGKVTVRCQCHLQHGASRPWWTPTADGGFDRTEGRTQEAFPTLAFEIPLDPADTLVIGPTADPDRTLGGVFFRTADESKRRVLVVRATFVSPTR